MTKKEAFPAEFKIKAIEVLETHIYPQKKDEKDSPFEFGISIEHHVNPSDESLMVITDVSVSNDKDELLGQMKTALVYETKNLLIFEEEMRVNLTEKEIGYINSIATSTTRGIMFSAFKGTPLQNAIMPIINDLEKV